MWLDANERRPSSNERRPNKESSKPYAAVRNKKTRSAAKARGNRVQFSRTHGKKRPKPLMVHMPRLALPSSRASARKRQRTSDLPRRQKITQNRSYNGFESFFQLSFASLTLRPLTPPPLPPPRSLTLGAHEAIASSPPVCAVRAPQLAPPANRTLRNLP